MVLACPTVQTFLIMAPAAVAIFHVLYQKRWRNAVAHGLALLLLAAAALAPWTLRNYLTFGEFVLVRTGGGQIAWVGTAGPAETFMPGAAKTPLPAPWASNGPRDAVDKMLIKDLRRQMTSYSVNAIAAAPPPGYEDMNEAQRDAIYMARAKEFMREHATIAAEMTLVKLQIYITKFGAFGVAIVALAVLGALLGLSDPRSWPLTLLATAFSGPFVLTVAYYGRYRAPVEPVFVALAAIAAAVILRSLASRTQLWRRPGRSAQLRPDVLG
jgi:hypothetical protein